MLSRFGVSALAGLLIASAASADITPSNPFAQISINNGNYSGSLNVTLDNPGVFSFNGIYFEYQLTLPDSLIYADGSSTPIAQVNQLTVTAWSPETAPYGLASGFEYRVNLSFNITNLLTTDSTISITSPTISFAGVNNAQAAASAGITLADSNSNGVGTVAGLFAGTDMWEATYNGSSIFATILQGGSVPGAALPFGNAENVPVAPGFVPVPGTVTSMMTKYSFSLTGGDSASGTSTFVIIPAPGAATLIGLGVATIASRRQNRKK